MKKSNYIADKVFNVNLKYVKLQNKTKELFFKCLDEERDIDYFKAELEKIWGKEDYSYINDEIAEYEAIIHERNIEGKTIIKDIPKGEEGSLFALVPAGVVLGVISKFMRTKEREYKVSSNSPSYKNDKQEYLKLKVDTYTNQVVPYYSKATGNIVRYVQPSTYNSMIHNTNLTRAGWNTTLNDADRVGVEYFVIKYHPFSCPHCVAHQNIIMSKQEVIELAGVADEADGDILHPNCKCELRMVDSSFDLDEIESPFRYNFTNEEKEEIYNIRQKTNTLTLRKEELLADIKIQKSLGNQDEVDKLNQKRNKINKSIRDLKEALPTDELKKQVVAINR